MNANEEIAVELEGVWKLFGQDAANALAAVQAESLSKQQTMERFQCVIGVADVNLQIRRGEIFCVMGLSGSGKSTLVRHINRLIEPTAGTIRVNGRNVMELSRSDLRDFRNQHISMVFQNFALVPHKSIVENVAMPLEIRGLSKAKRLSAAWDALAIVELRDWGNKYAHELSGGMQQRVGLARALAANAEVLLMDEPFSALDPLIRKQLQTEFKELTATLNKTTIFITHDLDEAIRVGDRIAVMRDGKIIQVGTSDEIVLTPADDYVAEFVSGISKLRVLRARNVMVPDKGDVTIGGASVPEDRKVVDLLSDAMTSKDPIPVVNDDGKLVGVIHPAELSKIASKEFRTGD